MEDGALGCGMPFDEAYQKHNAELMSYAWRRCGNRQDAEDLVQELWYKMYHRYGDVLPPEPETKNILYKGLNNLLADWYRRNKCRCHLPLDSADAIPCDSTDDCIERAHAKMILEELLSTSGLDPTERQILRLIYFEEMTQDEVAKRLRVSQSTVSRKADSALEKLRLRAVELFQPTITGGDSL